MILFYFMKDIIKDYEKACDAIVKSFEKKQGIVLDGWIGYYRIAEFSGEYFLGLDDIILDLRTKQTKGLILKWHDDTLHNNLRSNKKTNLINYNSYIMGLRYE